MLRIHSFPHDSYATSSGGAAAAATAKAIKASQACHSCKKQKRRCDKALPACGLCSRMARHCDYSEALPTPTADDIAALQLKLVELETRLNINGLPSETSLGQHSSSRSDHLPQLLPRETLWQHGPSSFPLAFFLDSTSFQESGLTLPKPTSQIPPDILQCLGGPGELDQTLSDYFDDVHPWFPMISRKRVTNCVQWNIGGDVVLLLLAMKLVTSQPQAGFTSADNYLYTASKRYSAFLESTGAASLQYLQALLIISLYEYGQGIYPSAWMTIGQCIRYSDFIGLSVHNGRNVLGPSISWQEDEERRRVWWAVYIMDKFVSLGSNRQPMAPEPLPTDYLPMDDTVWEEGGHDSVIQQPVTTPTVDSASKYGRLCQAAMIASTTLRSQHQLARTGESNVKDIVSSLEGSRTLCKAMQKEYGGSPDSNFRLLPARCLNFSVTLKLVSTFVDDELLGLTGPGRDHEETNMRRVVEDGCNSIVPLAQDLAANMLRFVTADEDVVKIPPMALDAVYRACVTMHNMWKESGDPVAEMSLQMARRCLVRLSGRWRLGREYLDMLDAHDMNYMVGQNSLSMSSVRLGGMPLVI